MQPVLFYYHLIIAVSSNTGMVLQTVLSKQPPIILFLCLHLLFLKKFPNNVPVPNPVIMLTSPFLKYRVMGDHDKLWVFSANQVFHTCEQMCLGTCI